MPKQSVSCIVLTCLFALGSLLGCRGATVKIMERSVPHNIDEAKLLPAEATGIDVESLTNTEYQGGPVLVLDENRIAVANGPTGTVYLGTEGPYGLHAITRFGTGPAELKWVHHLARKEEGLLAGDNGNPPIVHLFSVNGTYGDTVRLQYNYAALDTVGGVLVGFSSHPRQLRTSDTEPTLDGVSLLRSFEQLDDRRIRWESYPIRQSFADSDPDLLASSFSWAYREITAVALAVHGEEVYVLNTIHDNVQVYDASGRLVRAYQLLTRGPGNGGERFELLEGSTTRRYGSAADLSIDENGTVFISRLVFRGSVRGNVQFRTDVHDIDFNYLGSFATDQPGVWNDAYNGTLLLSSGGSFDPGLIRIDYGDAFEQIP